MANIAHQSIAEAYLHESKGVSTALANKVYITDGAGSGAWQYSNAHGSVYFVDFASPSILIAPTAYAKVAPTTTASGSPIEMTEATTARLTYTGTPTRHANLRANFTIDQTSGGARTVSVAVYKNGVIISSTEIQQVLTTSDKVNVSVQSNGTVATNDYYEIYMKISGTGNVQVYSLNMFMMAWI